MKMHPAVAFVTGAVAWSAAEYGLHRFAMHEQRGRNLASREHLLHHADPNWSSSKRLQGWIGIGLIGGLGIAPAVGAIAGPVGAAAAAGGWLTGYAGYEQVHAGAHRRPGRSAYSRWVRRHHFHHHFGHPMRNHGVTSPVWDWVFGTLDRPAQVRVPRRLSMPWLLDDAGCVHPELTGDYAVVGDPAGTACSGATELDRARAFENLAPLATT